VRRAAARRRGASSDGPATGVRPVVREGQAPPLVLLVDDHQDSRDLYSDHLAAAGFRVAEAVDGDHALLKVMALLPAVVVMDLSMPVLDGWEATRRIKAHPKTADVAVIVLTGQVTPESLKRAAEAGADAVLSKPYPPDALLAVVERLLGR
jgi:two-component system, cell cycle response regulator DivK